MSPFPRLTACGEVEAVLLQTTFPAVGTPSARRLAYFGEDYEDDADASDVDGEQCEESRQQAPHFPAEKLACFITNQRDTVTIGTYSCKYTYKI